MGLKGKAKNAGLVGGSVAGTVVVTHLPFVSAAFATVAAPIAAVSLPVTGAALVIGGGLLWWKKKHKKSAKPKFE
jgi:LPXTG-motif cell wall-anchored protein